MTPARPLLALDTSSHTARVAVVAADGALLAEAEKQAARHSSNLLHLVDDALRAAGLGVADLGAIACGAGPGSFTGLRVGMAVAKGLAMPFATPLVLVSSLAALARDLAHAGTADLLIPCIDAGKGQVYAQFFRRGEGDLLLPASAESPAHPGELCDLIRAAEGQPLVGGNGADRYLEIFRTALSAAAVAASLPGPTARTIARLAWERLARGESDELESAVPSYGRPPDITKPKRPQVG